LWRSFVSLLALSPKNADSKDLDVAVNETESVDKVNAILISELTEDLSYENISEERLIKFAANLDSFLVDDSLSFQIKMENLSEKNIVLNPVIISTEDVGIFELSMTRLSTGEEDRILESLGTESYEINVTTKESVNYPVEINISLKY
jgi:hypothetical protein